MSFARIESDYILAKSGSVAAIVLTYNEEKRVRECLESLSWCDEIWVVDSFSADRTVDISQEYTTHVVQNKFENFAIQRNWALDNLPFGTEWLMFVDADERVPSELRNEILHRIQKNEDVVAYYVPRKQIFWGRWARHGDWWPAYRPVLFRRGKGRFQNKEVHERIEIDGPIGTIHNPIVSEYWNSAEKMLAVLNYCTSAEALRMYRTREDLYSESSPSFSPVRQCLKTIFAMLPFKPLTVFVWKYFVKQGFRDGRIGFVLALEEAFYVFFAYFKLWELKRGLIKPPDDLIWRKQH